MPTPTPTTQFGKDVRLQIGDGAGTEVFANLGGESGLSFKQASNTIDTGDKDGPSGVQVPGQITWTVKGNVKLPDTAFSRAHAAHKSGAIINVKVVRGAIVLFAGAVTVGNMSADYDRDAAVPYSFDLLNAATPTTFDLGAIA